MTNQEKIRILKLRDIGLSYKEISVELNIPQSTISTFCIKNKSTLGCCALCKNAFINNIRGRRRKYCCDECRRKWWKSHNEYGHPRINLESTCKCCGKTFISHRSRGASFCSRTCYLKFYEDGGADD